MAVLSAPEHFIQMRPVTREDAAMLQRVWILSTRELSHAAMVDDLVESENNTFLIFDARHELVAFFPCETHQWWGVQVIHPHNFALTLDYVDVVALPDWQENAAQIFLTWVSEQNKTAAYLSMCDGDATLVRIAREHGDQFLSENRGVHYYLDIPGTLDDFIASRSKRVREDLRRTQRRYDTRMECIISSEDQSINNDELLSIFFRLHHEVFPSNSAMEPHRIAFTRYLSRGLKNGVIFFAYARDRETKEVVAIDVISRTHNRCGLIQNGRKTSREYNKIGTWLIVETIKWMCTRDIERFNFLLGDQEYKRRYSSGKNSALSITYFSSAWVKVLFRLHERLGRFLPSLR